MANVYRGYSSHEFQRIKSFTMVDIELVKMDLLNHIYTRKGERVMMPDWGTRIPEMAFEPLDADTIDIIREELNDVFNHDPRVELVKMSVVPDFDNNRLFIASRLLYVELQEVDDLELNLIFET